jgi:AcrR family transcriptional regulator
MRHPRAGGVAARATRERILRAASDLFARQGFSHVTMRAVAEAAVVTKPALYYHFRDKESLFEECLADFNQQLSTIMHAAVRRDEGMAGRVRAVAEALLTGSPFHPIRVHEELAEQVSGALRERLRLTFRSVVVTPVTELFEALQRSGELRQGVTPAAAAAVLIGTCMAFLGTAQAGDHDGWAPLPIDGLRSAPHPAAEVVADLVLHGLGAGAVS